MPTTFTPIEQRILKLLSDGLPHRKSELLACIQDELVEDKAMHAHIHRLRGKLRPVGQDIVCQVMNRAYQWRHVRLLCVE